MNALDVLELLEATSGSNAKIEILKKNKDNKELVFLLDAALNFKRKFYIKKLEEIGTAKKKSNVSITAFADLLNALESRSVTGNAAREWASTLLSDCNEVQQKWYSRVLLKDIKCNFGISSCVKAGIDIPEFEPMLAKDGKECKKLEEIVSKGVYVSPKMDGYRCLAFCDRGEVSLVSRNGTEYENFPTIIESLKAMCAESSFVLDGEIMSNDFNSMQQSAFASKRGTTVGDVVYHVFGWIDTEEWNSGDFQANTRERLGHLADLWQNNKAHIDAVKNLVKVDHDLVYKVSDVLELERQYLLKGFEGAMALPNIPYYFGKKTNKLLKFKTMLSQDCKVTGVYEGEGKNSGRLGGIHVVQEDGTPCDVGSGFSDSERDSIWANPKGILGRTVEVKYQELTPDGVMRFPVFIRWRADKDV